MKVILASPRGFCAGVNMAVESLDLAIQAFGTVLNPVVTSGGEWIRYRNPVTNFNTF